MAYDIKDKITVVTGGAGNIGSATVELFANKGSRLVILDLDNERGQELERRVSERTYVRFLRTDVTNEEDVKRATEEIKKDTHLGAVDYLLGIAGGALKEEQKKLDMDVETFRRSIELNLTSQFIVTKYISPLMVNRQGAGIVYVSTQNSLQAIGNAAYSAAKAGLNGMVRYLASVLGEKGIRVNAVAPGIIPSPRSIDLYGGNIDQNPVFQEQRKRIPLGYFGKAEDVAEALLYAATAEFLNGSIIILDGGAVSGRHIV